MKTIAPILFAGCLLGAGCTTPHVVERAPAVPPAAPAQIAAITVPLENGLVTTRYELGPYRYPRVAAAETVIERRTRIVASSAGLVSLPRLAYAPASLSPLPLDAELAAERATQREFTARLLRAHQAMAELEQRARHEFEALTAQTAITLQLREQLEAERARLPGRESRSPEPPEALAATLPNPAAPPQSLRKD